MKITSIVTSSLRGFYYETTKIHLRRFCIHSCKGHKVFCHSNMENFGRNFTVAVEGNIASGKTNMLQYFSKSPDVMIYEEPVKLWRNVQGHNLLDLMYSNPERWSLTFQTYVQLTMLDAHKLPPTKRVKLMERSIFSAKYCFVENLSKSGKMPEVEYIVLTEWFNWIIKHENIKLDLIIYLRTSPEVIFQRIKSRGRNEEQKIPMDYLWSLHNLHEEWLISQAQFVLPAPILILNGDGNINEMEEQFKRYYEDILCISKDKPIPTVSCDLPVNMGFA